MKKEFLLSLNDIDEGYLEDARPKPKKIITLPRLVIAASVLLVGATILTFALLGGKGGDDPIVELPDDIILDSYGYAVRDFLLNNETGIPTYAAGDSGGGTSEFYPNGNYLEVTDNQVEGIVEGDLAKATDKYLFRFGHHTIYIYSIAGEESTLISSYSIPVIDGEKSYAKYHNMFLSNDGRTLTLFSEYGGSEFGRTIIMSIDVSDVTSPKEKSRVILNGQPSTMRKIGDKFYLVTNWSFSKNRIDLYNPESYTPSIEYADGVHICDTSKIVYPEKLSGMSLRYLTVLDEDSLALCDELALMVSGAIYYTDNHMIFSSEYYTTEEEDGKTIRRCYSKVSVVNIANGLSWRGHFTIKGWTENQYNFDEHDGKLRIVASVSDRAGYTTNYDSVSLYVYDLETLTEVASVEEFAPYGEGATAVRFEGDKLYVCTANIIEYLDPVYFFDLSDYSDITYTDTGFIDGFSSSLIDIGEGYLIGVGSENGNTGKIEVYKRNGDSVISVDKYTLKGSIPDDYKSYLIDRENNIIGVGVSQYRKDNEDRRNVYLILSFKDEKLGELCVLETNISESRAFYHDGFIYFTEWDSFKVVKENGELAVSLKQSHTIEKTVNISSPGCGQMPLIENHCACGRVVSEKDYYAEYTSHDLKDGVCILCGEDVGSASKNADMIIYTPNGDGTCSVTGAKEAIIGVVDIPTYSPMGYLVTEIANKAFYMSRITKIRLPDSVKIIANYAFTECYKLTEIELGKVESIGAYAFAYCTKLRGVTLPNSLTKIGYGAFDGCEGLLEIYIPDSVTEIEAHAFQHCKSLRNVRLPEGMTVIPDSLFNFCIDLTAITIPESVTVIMGYAFNLCYSLTTVDIPDNVTDIGKRAFGGCKNLSIVELGKSVTNIESSAFDGCQSLFAITNLSSLDINAGSDDHGGVASYAYIVSADKGDMACVDGYVFIKADERTSLVSYVGEETALVLPECPIDGKYEIADSLFYGNKKITSVTIPEGVTAIGKATFAECSSLKTVNLPNSLRYIGEEAFYASAVQSIIMGDNVEVIETYAFKNCFDLAEVRLSKNLKKIGACAFYDCRSIKVIEVPSSVEEIGYKAFEGCDEVVYK